MVKGKRPLSGKNYVVVDDPEGKYGMALGQWDSEEGAYFFHRTGYYTEVEIFELHSEKVTFYSEDELIDIIDSVLRTTKQPALVN